MLLNFQVANWACFRDPMNFTMEAGPERDAGGHLVKIGAKSRPLKVLPVAAVYGNNASGKSQFIAALSFLRSLVIEEFKTGRPPLAPFLLDDTFAKEPTHFVIQFVDDYCTEGRIAERTLDYLARFDTGISRLDEMWVTDKAPDGSATLADFASFEGLRKGTKIRDIYLDGRLGGIPRHIGELGAVIKEVAYANA